MSNVPPPPPTPGSSSSAFSNSNQAQQRVAHHQTAASSIYSFSVHQPYTNWPLHASSSHYPSSWYPVHAQAYGQPRTFKDGQVQTVNDEEEKNSESGANEDETEEEEKQVYRTHWDTLLCTLLKKAGLHQALRGFKDDLLVMNGEWERDVVPGVLREFVRDMTELLNDDDFIVQSSEQLDDRKLKYVKPAKGVDVQTPSSLTRSIALFLAQSRHRNDASNREEFIQSIAEKRRRLSPDESASNDESPPPSCARSDAKAQDRDVQMKYDVAKNEDGPLKRTMRAKVEPSGVDGIPIGGSAKGKQRATMGDFDTDVTVERHPGLAGRLADVETHLAVRYVPSPPQSLMDRLRFIEDHIVKLETDYPPWAALHFNQPNRGWPPPPRVTPIIVPSHLTSSAASPSFQSSLSPATASSKGKSNPKSHLESPFTSIPFQLPSSTSSGTAKATGKGSRAKSSLHRAVLERLEVQRAMGDLAEGKYAHVAGPSDVMQINGAG